MVQQPLARKDQEGQVDLDLVALKESPLADLDQEGQVEDNPAGRSINQIYVLIYLIYVKSV